MTERTNEAAVGQLAEKDQTETPLAAIGEQAREEEVCSICWAGVPTAYRDRHLDWHASLAREVERERLPQVYGGATTPPGLIPTVECDRCEGTGDRYGRSTGLSATCPDCSGNGQVISAGPPARPTPEPPTGGGGREGVGRRG